MQRKRMYSFIILSIILLISFKFSFEYLYGFILDTKHSTVKPDNEVVLLNTKEENKPDGIIEEKKSKLTTMKGERTYREKKVSDLVSSFKSLLTTYNVIRLIILVAVFIFLYRRYSKTVYALYNKLRNKRLHISRSYTKLDTEKRIEKMIVQSTGTSNKDITYSRLGKLLYEFNQSLPTNQKRNAKETVNEWFDRIDFSESSEIYELYRYGNLQQIDENLLNTFSRELKKFINQNKGGTHT